MGKIIYVDIDGFLCTDNFGIYRKAKPMPDKIKKVNQAYENGDTIVIYTGRGNLTKIDWTDLTLKQLSDWGVKYHHIRFDKPYFDEIWDDRCKDCLS